MKKINIRGMIIKDSQKEKYDNLNIENTSPGDVINQIVEGEELEITINSIGGDLLAGGEIYTALKSHNAKIKINIIFAASIATVVAMAGDEVLISPTGQFMIHNVSVSTDGDYRKMEKLAVTLKDMNSTIIQAYKARTNKSEEELSKLMDNETWFNAQGAKDNGFVDGIMFEEVKELSFVACLNESANKLAEMTNANEDDKFLAIEKQLQSFQNELTEMKNQQKQEPTLQPVQATNKRKGFLF
ncbi:head maturation protease, ClpP-related [Lysinibacillus sp. M3]|uniref:ATP-dependent Clp protease proteolytic subunit n=1 Tax=Lysinibacillus zambalensis TaxID=3160866 RepID=A0ABV1MN57_9BACI